MGPSATSAARQKINTAPKKMLRASQRGIARFRKMRKDRRRKCKVNSEVSTAVTMKNAAFRDVALCAFSINQRFGGTCRLHLQARRNNASRKKY
jgi:hypothetical protein